jgi:hypothetical protein
MERERAREAFLEFVFGLISYYYLDQTISSDSGLSQDKEGFLIPSPKKKTTGPLSSPSDPTVKHHDFASPDSNTTSLSFFFFPSPSFHAEHILIYPATQKEAPAARREPSLFVTQTQMQTQTLEQGHEEKSNQPPSERKSPETVSPPAPASLTSAPAPAPKTQEGENSSVPMEVDVIDGSHTSGGGEEASSSSKTTTSTKFTTTPDPEKPAEKPKEKEAISLLDDSVPAEAVAPSQPAKNLQKRASDILSMFQSQAPSTSPLVPKADKLPKGDPREVEVEKAIQYARKITDQLSEFLKRDIAQPARMETWRQELNNLKQKLASPNTVISVVGDTGGERIF